jgi:hypothetical protein
MKSWEILMKSWEILMKSWEILMKSLWNPCEILRNLDEILKNLDEILRNPCEILRNPEKSWWNPEKSWGILMISCEILVKSWRNLDEILMKSWWNLAKSWWKSNEILPNLEKSWEVLNEILVKSWLNSREIGTNSINFRRNSTVSGRNLTLSGVSLSMDPSGYGNIWRADAIGTDRNRSDLFRRNPVRNPLVRIPVNSDEVLIGFSWEPSRIPVQSYIGSDRFRSDLQVGLNHLGVFHLHWLLIFYHDPLTTLASMVFRIYRSLNYI